jgi:hypothetical protein
MFYETVKYGGGEVLKDTDLDGTEQAKLATGWQSHEP